jgi:hypothetical protein
MQGHNYRLNPLQNFHIPYRTVDTNSLPVFDQPGSGMIGIISALIILVILDLEDLAKLFRREINGVEN